MVWRVFQQTARYSLACLCGECVAMKFHRITEACVGGFDRWQRWVADHFGGKRPLLEHVVQLGRYRLGLLRPFAEVTWPSVERLVFVCHGNICRSPYSEVVAREKHGVATVSFGIEAKTGVGANESAMRNAAIRQVDLTAHRATSRSDFVARDNDLLVAMEPRQGLVLQDMAERSTAKMQVTLLGLWAAQPRPHIADPYGCGDAYFQNCFGHIDAAVEGIVTRCR